MCSARTIQAWRRAHLWSGLIANETPGAIFMKHSQDLVFRSLSARFCRRPPTLLIAMAAVLIPLVAYTKADAAPTRSTTIALTSDEQRLVVVNREANSVSIIRVKNANGKDVSNKLAEIPVGEEPRCVAIRPSDRAAYVTNAI